MTSSTREQWWLQVRIGTERRVVRPGSRSAGALRTEPGRPLVLEVSGLEPAERVAVELGGDDLELTASEQGKLRWSPAHLLEAVAGIVLLQVRRRDGSTLGLELDVKPGKLAERSLVALLRDLDAVSAGLSADLGGRGGVYTDRRAGPEGLLQILEQVTGVVAEATAAIRTHPLTQVREVITVVPAASPRLTARGARWLCQHPVAQERARASGREAAVRVRIDRDLDVPENRGAMGVLARLQALLRDVGVQAEEERLRIEAGRAAREAFRTRRSNLFAERDVPRLRALASRQARALGLAEQVQRARRRTGLPGSLARGPLCRSARIEEHPGYWGLYRVADLVEKTQAPLPAPALQPVRNLDELYETWCAIRLASVLAKQAGTSIGKVLRLEESGWFVRLARGEIARVEIRGREFRLHYEPVYEWAGRGPLVKLHPGRPWSPDLVIEERSAGQPVALHVFDAKHRIDPNRPDLLPMEAMREVWFKYPDSIGFAQSLLPAVASAWILYPGRAPGVHLLSPRMMSPDWPTGRVRGGAVSLVPGVKEAGEGLAGLVGTLLGAVS